MSTETLKITLAQKILSISDYTLLNKLKALIEKENIVGYDAKGKPIYESEYIKEMNQSIKEIQNGTAILYSTDEVKKNILDANSLA